MSSARTATEQSAQQPIAIVLGGDVNGLGQVRALGQAGVPVAVICAHRREPAAHSRYATAVIVPKGEDYDTRLQEAICAVAAQSSGRPPLLASSDAFVEFIARHRDQLGEHCAFNIVDDDTLFRVTDKVASQALARQCGIDAPALVPMEEFVRDSSLASAFTYPALVKPRDSYTMEFPWKNCTVSSPVELENILRDLPRHVPHALVQQIIPGPESSIYQCNVYIGKLSPPQFCTVQKLRQQPVGFGTMCFGRSRWMPGLVDETARLLGLVSYTGFASVEFKQSSADGRFYLIEINPRLPWYNSLFAKCGINFSLLAYRDLVGTELEKAVPVEPEDDIYWLHLLNELRGAWERIRCGQASMALRGFPGLWRARSFGLFSLSDPRPFLVGYANYTRDFLRKLRRR